MASAGSGKTYQLALRFVGLSLKYPFAFKSILAVTFTKKATAEMKDRILQNLNALADGDFSDHHYIQTLKQHFLGPITNNELQQKATETRNAMLYHFGQISVSTIDSFFQRILFAFAHEYNIDIGTSVELDTNGTLETVVEALIENEDNDANLQQLLTESAIDKIAEGKSWDFRRELLEIGRQLFKEEFIAVENYEQMLLRLHQDVNQVQQQTWQLIKTIKETIAQQAQQLWNELAGPPFYLTEDDFPYKKSGPGGNLKKIANGSLKVGKLLATMAQDPPKAMAPRNAHAHAQIEALFAHNQWIERLNQLLDYIEQNQMPLATAQTVVSQLSYYKLLAYLSQQLTKWRQTEKKKLISDVGPILKTIIAGDQMGNTAPMVLEKTGTQYRHYFIDEFQDTSPVQWQNFKPLVENALAEGSYNMLVGDVKQAIYRFRGGSYDLMLNGLNQYLATKMLESKPLTTNWRSKANIIEFNNAFFEYAPQAITNVLASEVPQNFEHAHKILGDLQNAYLHQKQDVSAKQQQATNKGLVHLEAILPIDKNEEDDETATGGSVNEQALEKMIAFVAKCQQQGGYRAKDFLILTRRNAEVAMVAQALDLASKEGNYPDVDFTYVSSEALRLGSKAAVRVLVAALKYIIMPENLFNARYLIQQWLLYITNKPTETHNYLFKADAEQVNQLLKQYLPEQFVSNRHYFARLSFYELCDTVMRYLQLHQNPTDFAYLEAFQSALIAHMERPDATVFDFFEWWEAKGINSFLKADETANAIKLLTVHKAKGLQNKVVLLPFAKWNFAAPKGIMWAKATNLPAPFNIVPQYPVSIKKDLAQTFFAQDYHQENIKQYIDNLNLLYVAFTRAEDVLGVWYKPNKDNNSTLKNTASLIAEMLTALKTKTTLGLSDQEGEVTVLGCMPKPEAQPQTNTGIDNRIVHFSSVRWRQWLTLRPREEFFGGAQSEVGQQISAGNLLHELMEAIENQNQIETQLNRFVLLGKVPTDQKPQLQQKLISIFSIPEVQKWFGNNYQAMKERTLMVPGGKAKKPDRVVYNQSETVVIDYKTGTTEPQKYFGQVRAYCNLLTQMGYPSIQGYLLYLDCGQLHQVPLH